MERSKILRNALPLVLAALMPLLAFTSCSDDDNDVVDSPIIGTWETGNSLLDIVSTITFHSDGTVTSVETYGDESYTDKGTYAIDGGTVTIYWDSDDEAVEMDFTIDGDTMVTYMHGEEGYTEWERA